MLRKMTDELEKYADFFIGFSLKKDAKSGQKSRKTPDAIKIDKKRVPETQFPLHAAILGYF